MLFVRKPVGLALQLEQETFTMRDLETSELSFVYGAGCSPTPPAPTKKGNNGFGNGSDAPNLAAPGGSAGSPGDKDNSLLR